MTARGAVQPGSVLLAELRGASVRFDGGMRIALADVRVAAGDRIAVIGSNGTGKTTLLRVLAGLATAEGGVDVRVERSAVAFVPAKPYLLRGTALWNVELALAARGVPRRDRRSRAAAALAELGGAGLAARTRTALSDGEAQRVALARALVTDPRLLLLDEPLASLDAAGAALLAEALAAREDLAVVAAAPAATSLPASLAARVVSVGGPGG